MYIIHYIFFDLHVSEDLVVKAGAETADQGFFLAAQVIRQVHHLLDLSLAVLAIAVVHLLLYNIGCRLRLSMVRGGGSRSDWRLFL
jgi:hypothetical protein